MQIFTNNIDKRKYRLAYSTEKRFNDIVREIRKTDSKIKRQRINAFINNLAINQ